MKKQLFSILAGLILLMAVPAFGQRQELFISPIGFAYPKNQLVQYERYVDSRQSLTFSLSHNGDARVGILLRPPRMEHFSMTRGAIGYRYYLPVIGEELMLFGSVRAVVDYSNLQLKSDSRYPISADSLRASGFSLAPELLAGGKATFANRITVSGAIGMQYLFKLLPTDQITQNRAYWDASYWTNDQQDWAFKRSVVTNFRRGWYPSFLITVGVVLGKRPLASAGR